MDYIDLALVTGAIVVGVGLFVLLVQHLTGRSARGRCPSCGAALFEDDVNCSVCDAEMNLPARQPGGEPSKPATVTVERTVVHDERGGTLNPGVRPWMVKGALAVMFGGLAVRVLGMLEPMGLTIPVPMSVMAALTVVGGLAAFIGFVVLDIA